MFIDDNAETQFELKLKQVTMPIEGQLVVSEPCVMESPAGFYVGHVCAEWLHETWLYMPYSRDTDYMTKEQAYEWLNMLLEDKE